VGRLVPESITCPSCGRRDRLEIHDHIVDVWFESGVSHSAVLGRDGSLPWPADLYLEGHDQYRGWFHSSLLVAANDRGKAPYRGVVTHGFTLDGDGRKMSKSLGNTISPLEVCDRRGAEILRLWVSMIDFLEDMRLSQEILDRNAEAYRKIRNTFRYLLGNLHGFRPGEDLVPYDEMEEIDRWAMHQLEEVRGRILDAYAGHQYHLVYHALNQFCTVTLSSFYLDILKDRLYTSPARSRPRRSAQTVLWHLARDLARLMSPILCFTAEEVWQEIEALDGRERWGTRSVHAETAPEPRPLPDDREMRDRWARLIPVREEIYRALEAARAARKIGSGLEAELVVEAPAELEAFLRSFGESLRFYVLTSGVRFGATDPADRFESASIPGLRVTVRPHPGRKCERCWHRTEDVGSDPEWPEICARCAGSVRA
jgi:isoleucyl-tRNA synthetase